VPQGYPVDACAGRVRRGSRGEAKALGTRRRPLPREPGGAGMLLDLSLV